MFRPSTTSIFTSVAQLTDHLYLCAARAVNINMLQEKDVTCVINATIELPNLPVPGIEYVKVAVDDSPFANISIYFDKIADLIHETCQKGGKTLVHCVAGVSRSASLCIAYLLKYDNMSLYDAYKFVKERRPIIRPNNGFFRQLIDYERKLYNRETVSIIPSAAGMIPDVYEQEYRNLLLVSTPRTRAIMASNNSDKSTAVENKKLQCVELQQQMTISSPTVWNSFAFISLHKIMEGGDLI